MYSPCYTWHHQCNCRIRRQLRISTGPLEIKFYSLRKACPVVKIHFFRVTVRGKGSVFPGVEEHHHNGHVTDAVVPTTVSTFLHCWSSSLATIVSVLHTAYGSVSWSPVWHASFCLPSLRNQIPFYCDNLHLRALTKTPPSGMAG